MEEAMLWIEMKELTHAPDIILEFHWHYLNHPKLGNCANLSGFIPFIPSEVLSSKLSLYHLTSPHN